jgi:hypothetical protein
MANLKSKFDILRGWPQQSAVQEDFIIGGVVNHEHHQGTWVKLADSYTTADNKALVDSSATTKCFLVIEGRDDYSSQFANRVTVLLGGGYVVRLDGDTNRVSVAQFSGNAFSAGNAVKVVNGVIQKYGDQNDTVDMIVGTVLKFDANSKTLDVFVH